MERYTGKRTFDTDSRSARRQEQAGEVSDHVGGARRGRGGGGGGERGCGGSSWKGGQELGEDRPGLQSGGVRRLL